MNTAAKPPLPPKPLAPCAGLFGAWCTPGDKVANDRDRAVRREPDAHKPDDR